MPTAAVTPQTLGVLAFGDSITNGGGELQWGVALQSWALWTARGLGLPYSTYAVDGARVRDVLAVQIPRFERATPSPHARFDLGCLYIGVNDVRALDWDVTQFARDFRAALEFVAARCDRTLTMTAPLDLGRPRAGAKVCDLNVVIVAVAAQVGALVIDLSDFHARNHVMTDHVHPTAFGQIAIAERALAVLERDGMRVVVAPHALIAYSVGRRARLRADLTYLYRHTKVSLRSLALRLGAGRWRRFWED